MNIDAYLDRIGLDHRPPPTLDGLRAVHRAHIRIIPYENLDVQLGRPVTIERPAIYDKIVTRRRGGWCYEMNGLLGWALGEMGFKVTRATGAVMRAAAGDAKNGNHLVLRVDLPEGTWLAEAHIGEPRPLGQIDAHLAAADEARFAARCHELQTDPNSHFILNLFCFKHRADDILLLRGRVLHTTRPDGYDDRLLESADDLVATLRDDFTLDVPEIAAIWPNVVARHAVVMAQAPA